MSWSGGQTGILNSSSPDIADILTHCKDTVQNIQNVVKIGNLLNEKQCLDLFSKLSKTTRHIQNLVSQCRASSALFRPALEYFIRCLEKAKRLVNQCGEEDWCTAAVFQIQNENAFRQILQDVGLCYNVICGLVASITSEAPDLLPQDLRQPASAFVGASQQDVQDDQHKLQRRLETVASEHGVARKQLLARYLLKKLKYTLDPSQANSSDILWAKDCGPDIWGPPCFLGSGSGGSGVLSTKWMGIPCAKKEFHGKEYEPLFLKEAGILARLKHPCTVNFICCGNGDQKGDRFIAMELMEKSLYDVMVDQGALYFPLDVVVDIMVQMARGMCYLHDQGVAHRDLKPQNVVVRRVTSLDVVDHFCVKLVDFGVSKLEVQASKSSTISLCGGRATHYRAPEVHPKAHPKAHPKGTRKAIWFKADVFSFAMTCAHIVSLKKPFGDIEPSELYEEVMKGTRPKLPMNYPEELNGLLRDCWNTSPGLRPSFREIITRLEALRYKMLGGSPTSTTSSVEEGSHPSHSLGEDCFNMCFKEANENIELNTDDDALQPDDKGKSLLCIKQKTIDNVGREERDREVKLLHDRLDKERLNADLKNEIYQLVGFFSVMQVAVLAMVIHDHSQSSQVTRFDRFTRNCQQVWVLVILTAFSWVTTIIAVWPKFIYILELIDDERIEEDIACIENIGLVVFIYSLFTGVFICSYFKILCNLD